MKFSFFKIAIPVLFIISASILLIIKSNSGKEQTTKSKTISKEVKQLPRLVDLGAHKCIPCKMMMPILDTLRDVYSDQLIVEFIDVWQDREAGNKYGISSIPTQIFFDEKGIERFRHVGFWSRADIEAKFVELGITLQKKG